MQVFTGFNNQVQLKCTNCLIQMASEQEYKQHYKSQFHRYNIKRKVLGLKPATFDQFNIKRGDTNPEQSNLQKGFECKPCRKSFTNDGVYKQHLQSKKHQEQMSKENIVVEKKARRVEARGVFPELCLFCDVKSDDVKGNEVHMERVHGFFISQKEFCKDIEGLIKYLHEKVDVGLLCVYCDNKGFKEFQNGAAIRSHMKDKSHCFMNTSNGFEEYEKFYDFGVLFDERVEDQKRYRFIPGLESDVVEVEIQQAVKKVKRDEGVKEGLVLVEVKGEKDDEEGDWEDEEEDVEEWSDASEDGEEGENVEGEVREVKQEKTKIKTKKYLMYKPTVVQSGELLLPNGKLLGTRKYRHLYRQYYRPTVLAQNRRMLTGAPLSNQLVLKSQRLLFFRKQMKQINSSKLFERNRGLKLSLNQNNLQYHFRVQNPK